MVRREGGTAQAADAFHVFHIGGMQLFAAVPMVGMHVANHLVHPRLKGLGVLVAVAVVLKETLEHRLGEVFAGFAVVGKAVEVLEQRPVVALEQGYKLVAQPSVLRRSLVLQVGFWGWNKKGAGV